jgi:dihydrofolate synthase/folylpolyglutamate synthase
LDHNSVTQHPSIEYLYGLQYSGIKLGLDNIAVLCAHFGDPHKRFASVHVAGTNGKGSVCSFIASILRAAGYKTGLYTSPHLVDFTERIRVDGESMPVETLAAYTEELRPLIDSRQATFFEATTAIAFRYFADQGVDVAVVETGLGGRLDATNILAPEATVITSIDIDHCEFLGNTIPEIAFEKAGIIKRNTPLFFQTARPDARDVIAGTAAEKGAPYFELLSSHVRAVKVRDFDRMDVQLDPAAGQTQVRSPLVGRHQAYNLALAMMTARTLAERGWINITDEAIATGIASVRELSCLRGRMERLQIRPELVVDVCHNAAGVDALLRTWTLLRRPDCTHLIFGLQATKDCDAIAKVIARHKWKSVVVVRAKSSEAARTDVLQAALAREHVHSGVFDTVMPGVDAALTNADEGDSILLFGSHYVTGEYFYHRYGMKKNDQC